MGTQNSRKTGTTMRRVNQKAALAVSLTVLLALQISNAAADDPVAWKYWLPSDEASAASFDHSDWQYILDAYLTSDDPSGINLFSYNSVTLADRDRLDGYINRLAAADPRKFNRAEQRAYWVNLYNALTVALVIDFYPVESIREIHGGVFDSGPWDTDLVEIAGRQISLNDIEHRILRPIYRDPRTHYSINCASIGCPNLAAEAYTRDNMERLLDEGAEAFINHPRGAAFENEKLRLSSIYKWFSGDFGPDEAALINHLRRYAEPPLAEQLQDFSNKIIYEYDWSLNEP